MAASAELLAAATEVTKISEAVGEDASSLALTASDLENKLNFLNFRNKSNKKHLTKQCLINII